MPQNEKESFALGEREDSFTILFMGLLSMSHTFATTKSLDMFVTVCVCVCVRKLKLKPSLALRNEGFALFLFFFICIVVVIFGADLANWRAEKKTG